MKNENGEKIRVKQCGTNTDDWCSCLWEKNNNTAYKRTRGRPLFLYTHTHIYINIALLYMF
jgi:hypothetical protein